MGSMDTAEHASWRGFVDDRPVDEPRPMRVICLGAGISGIAAGIRLPRAIPNIDLVIYEKNSDIGGTWHENRYPGVRCDIPSANYQYTFESNTQWSQFYASGPEIQQYLLKCARKYGVYRYCKFHHKFVGAKWMEDDGMWEVEIRDMEANKTFVDRAEIVITATGLLNRWDWPDIPDLHEFKGKKVHSADWDSSIQLTKDMRVALIGAGSSGIQLLPTIQPLVGHVDHYMKGRTWISPVGAGARELIERKVAGGNFNHSADELQKFASEEGAYWSFRKRIENDMNQAQTAVFFGTEPQKAFHEMTKESMEQTLKTRPDILHALLPDFPVGCRRLTPGPGYLEACMEENVEFIPTAIKKATATGLETVDGTQREIDLLICATGFDVSRQGELPFVGQGGITLDEVWSPYPEAYLSICPPKMPNLFMFLGPNGGPGTGGTFHMIEHVCDYIVECVKKIQREWIKSMVVRADANAAFSKHVDLYFSKTVFDQPCRSWYKRGQLKGRLVTPWPGSGVHAQKALQHPRWEDFEYERLPPSNENMMAWLGMGLTMGQKHSTDTTEYLDEVMLPKPADQSVDTGTFGRQAKNGVLVNGTNDTTSIS